MKCLMLILTMCLMLLSCTPENKNKCAENETNTLGTCVVKEPVTPYICSSNQTQSLDCSSSIANGSGQYTRTCSSNSWESYGACTVHVP